VIQAAPCHFVTAIGPLALLTTRRCCKISACLYCIKTVSHIMLDCTWVFSKEKAFWDMHNVCTLIRLYFLPWTCTNLCYYVNIGKLIQYGQKLRNGFQLRFVFSLSITKTTGLYFRSKFCWSHSDTAFLREIDISEIGGRFSHSAASFYKFHD